MSAQRTGASFAMFEDDDEPVEAFDDVVECEAFAGEVTFLGSFGIVIGAVHSSSFQADHCSDVAIAGDEILKFGFVSFTFEGRLGFDFSPHDWLLGHRRCSDIMNGHIRHGHILIHDSGSILNFNLNRPTSQLQ